MKIFKFLSVAALAALTVVSCKDKSSEYEKLVESAKDSLERAKVELPSEEKMDDVSYLLGVNYGMMVAQNKFFDAAEDMNEDKFMKGFEDAMVAGQPKQSNPYQFTPDSVWAKKFDISPYEMNKLFNEYLSAKNTYLAELNKIVGEKFLAANAKKEDVVTTPSGLQYVLRQEGEGEMVASEDRVVVNYKGTLLDGTEFDANDSTEFAVNRVISGWTEGLTYMNKGAKATLYIPGDLAYGANAPRGSVIEPNSTLVFEVEVLEVIKPAKPEVEAEVEE